MTPGPQGSPYAVLLAGGSGTRFWPASRGGTPKQFLRIAGERPMLAETAARLEGLNVPERTLVVTTREQGELVRELLPGIPRENVLLEPLARNTGPAVALAALEIRRRDPAAVQIVLPADHVIRPVEGFRRTGRAAVEEARDSGSLLVFGIEPTRPATGFGWIRSGGVLRQRDGVAIHRVQGFVEKPDLARAQLFLDEGGSFWNSGMFVWTGEAIERELREHAPALHAALAPDKSRALSAAELERAYERLPGVAIDVALMERTREVRMLALDFAWSDVGSWDALAEIGAKDPSGNFACGGAALVALDSGGSIVHAPAGELVALIGVEDLIVVHAGGATLVCRRDRAQDVKKLVDELRERHRDFV